jgi:hypothetical protein
MFSVFKTKLTSLKAKLTLFALFLGSNGGEPFDELFVNGGESSANKCLLVFCLLEFSTISFLR